MKNPSLPEAAVNERDPGPDFKVLRSTSRGVTVTLQLLLYFPTFQSLTSGLPKKLFFGASASG